MTGIPASCSKCNIVFEYSGIQIQNSNNINFSGMRTSCPQCGGPAVVVDGTFDELGNGLEIVSAPAVTHSVFEALYGVVQKIESGEINQSEAVEKIEELSPELAQTVRTFISVGIPILSFIGVLISLYFQYDAKVSNEDYERETLNLMQQQIEILEEINSKQNARKIDAIQTYSIKGERFGKGAKQLNEKRDRLTKKQTK